MLLRHQGRKQNRAHCWEKALNCIEIVSLRILNSAACLQGTDANIEISIIH